MSNPPAHPATIRAAAPQDAPALAAFGARAFDETFGPDNDPAHTAAHLATTFGALQQGRELADPDWRTLLVERDGAICGYAQLRRRTPPPGVTGPVPIEIARFYIDRAYHGQGLAQRLMTAAWDAARRLGGQTVWLSVWERNPRAVAFYEKCGFRDVGTVDFMLGGDRQTDRLLEAPLGPGT